MAESAGSEQTESVVATPTQPQPPQTQELSQLLKQKEPEDAETSSSVKQERTVDPLPKDHAPSSLDQIPAAGTETRDSVDRDAVLARVESEKRLALIKAWEENEKTKVENKAYKMHSAVELWEDSKKASMEAKLKEIQIKLDKKKAEYVEIVQNKIGEIHRQAQEKKAMIEAQKGEEFLKVEETAAKFRTRGYVPRKLLACFGI